jgi:hypothetical protein
MGNWFTNLFKGRSSEAQVDEKIQPESGNVQMPQEQGSQSMDMGNNPSPETEPKVNLETETSSVEMPGLSEESSVEKEITKQEEAEEERKEL